MKNILSFMSYKNFSYFEIILLNKIKLIQVISEINMQSTFFPLIFEIDTRGNKLDSYTIKPNISVHFHPNKVVLFIS